MAYKPSPLYLANIDFNSKREAIKNAINRGCKNDSNVFFRADDIAVPSKKYAQLIALFKKHQLPLALAVVPSWLSEKRWQNIFQCAGTSDLWCWHQHGRLHRNFETTGKKQEFGPARHDEEIALHLCLGFLHLQKIMGEELHPLFTPPWNRCSSVTMETLLTQGFKAISRSRGAKPIAPKSLPDLQVNVDLHTRREPDAETSFEELLKEIEESLQNELCGIMIHHQCMNEGAFTLLDIVLDELKKQKNITFVNIKEYLNP